MIVLKNLESEVKTEDKALGHRIGVFVAFPSALYLRRLRIPSCPIGEREEVSTAGVDLQSTDVHGVSDRLGEGVAERDVFHSGVAGFLRESITMGIGVLVERAPFVAFVLRSPIAEVGWCVASAHLIACHGQKRIVTHDALSSLNENVEREVLISKCVSESTNPFRRGLSADDTILVRDLMVAIDVAQF